MENLESDHLPPILNEVDCGEILSGVAVPHPPRGRRAFCKNILKEQKDKVSPEQDTFSTWCNRPVQLPDLWGTHVCDTDLKPTDGTSEITDVEVLQAPQRSSEWFAFCKHFKEEQKDRPSARQDTSSWCRQLLKVRRMDSVTDPSNIRFPRLTKLPEIQREKDHEEEIGKLKGILLEDARRKQGSKKSPESHHCRDADSPPEQENIESETCSRRLAKAVPTYLLSFPHQVWHKLDNSHKYTVQAGPGAPAARVE
ncbi:hypothetical protein E1301_Tti019613 [Triplophysa tibetana]|uniref:Uncharacterized protein n=1 Tax=Triplophysa tibetana TaxID=1572043 RepID=A0A5A9PHF7_9TELE|nr:hypothetical protein E1301_Tti019613 [Triplophysa tibetana]